MRRATMPNEKPDLVKSWGKLLGYLDRYRKFIYIAIASCIVAVILNLIGPNRIQELTDQIINGLLVGHIDMDAIWNIIVVLIAIYVLCALFQFISNFILTRISIMTTKNMRTDISEKINRVPLSYFDKTSTGDILSRVTNDADTLGESLSACIGSLFASVTMLIGSIIMMLYTNWIMAIVAIMVSVFGFALTGFIMFKSQKYFKMQQNNLGRMNGLVEEIYTGHDVVKVYNDHEKCKTMFDEINGNLYESAFKSQFFGGMMMPLMNLIGNIGYVAVCLTGAILMINGSGVTFGVITAFMIYVRLFTQPLTQIAQIFVQMQSVAATSTRIFEFLELDEMESEEGKTERLGSGDTQKTIKGSVEFRDVHFGYTPDKEIIHGFSAKIEPGQKIAIVGPTGAGKTTIVNLLMRFYEVNSGDILIDGKSTKDVPRENVHEQFCMVLQDTWIYEGTIKDNVRYCEKNVSNEDIVKACEAVGISHFIETLPEKYNTKLSDKVTISAGQRQQITIARAMVQKAPMLILDEATSSVDTRTEKIIQEAMDKLTKDRTSFVIAHRLSTIKNADMILVMRDGSIVEQGKHDDLLAMGGFYAELYNSQFSEE